MDTDSNQEEDDSVTMPPSMAQPATPTDWSLDPNQIRDYLFRLIENEKLSPELALRYMKEHPNAQVPSSVLAAELHKFQVLLSISRHQEAESTPIPEDQWQVP